MARTRSLSMNLHGPTPPSVTTQQRMDEVMYELKETLALLRYEWPQVLEETSNPIEMAVSLLDDSSVGLAHKTHEFQDLTAQVQGTLRRVVNEYYEIFNNSIGSYHMLLSTIQDCQQDSKQIREMLEDTKKDAHDRSDALNDLNNTSARYSEMIEILDAMDELNQIPTRIERLINDKKVHEIYDVISGAYKLAEQYNLWSLSAMASIKSYLELQSNNLFDMIIDELHNEIYLKTSSVATPHYHDGAVAAESGVGGGSGGVDASGSASGGGGGGSSAGNGGSSAGNGGSGGGSSGFHSAASAGTEYWQFLVQSSNPQLSSFKTLLTQSHNLEQYIYNSANLDIAEIAACFSESVDKFIARQLPKIHNFYAHQQAAKGSDNVDYSILLESTSNSNTESFHYVYSLLYTAYKLNRLQQVLDILANTNQQEFHTLINTTTNETKLKNTQQLHKLSKIQGSGVVPGAGASSSAGESFDLLVGSGGSSGSAGLFNDAAVIVLQDLFGNVFIKSLAVLQKHKVVQEIVKRILAEDGSAGGASAGSTASGSSHTTSTTTATTTTGGSGAGTPRSSTPVPPHSHGHGHSTDSRTYFETAWTAMQKELQALMMNYIYDRSVFTKNNGSDVVTDSSGIGSGIAAPGSKSQLADVLKRSTFKFENVSITKSARSTEELQLILNDMFPGFNLNGDDKSTVLENLSPYIKNESFNAMVEILVPRNIFNMRIILESFLIYVAGAQHLFKPAGPQLPQHIQQSHQQLARATGTASTAAAAAGGTAHDGIRFFNVFMTATFLPKLRDTLNTLFVEFLSGSGSGSGSSKESFRGELTIVDQRKDVAASSVAVTVAEGSGAGSGAAAEGSSFAAPATLSSSIVDQANAKTLTIYQNALDFQKLIMYICFVLNTSLTYRKEFGDLCLQYLTKFANKYEAHYKELLEPPEEDIVRTASAASSSGGTSSSGTNTTAPGKPSSQINTWMRIPALTEISGAILRRDGQRQRGGAAAGAAGAGAADSSSIEKEVEIMLANSNTKTLSKDDFLDGDTFSQICHLLLTTTWILSWLPGMRKESNYSVYDDDTDDIKLSEVDKLKHDWSFLENGRSSSIDHSHIFLTLNSAKIGQFDAIVDTFTKIREGTLLALRYDLRCKAIYYITRSYADCDWVPAAEPADCDQYISEYNKHVFLVDNKLTQVLLDESERDNIFVGLSKFLESLTVRGARSVAKMNANGIKRVLLNIFVLQQMLRNIMNQPESIDFNNSSVFFEMFTHNEVTLVDAIREQQERQRAGAGDSVALREDDYKNLARLIYSEKLADGGGSSFHRTKYNDLLKKISAVFE